MKDTALKTIYLAGGCFWGIEAFFSKLNGIVETTVGYANGKSDECPSYENVCTGTTGYNETVKLNYNPKIISLKEILYHYFDIIDPTTLNRQAFDIGTQYRTGIYYIEENDEKIILDVITYETEKYTKPIVVEVEKLKSFYAAEDYHQNYLDKNPQGYCHIDFSKLQKYKKPPKEILKEKLTDLQYDVTQNNGTEKPFTNPYYANHDKGIYVEIITGEPLFSSDDKYNSGSGWPSFTKTIEDCVVKENTDKSSGMERTEVRSKYGNSHLGHVFDDGPSDKGGKRYCINGAALKFIPKKEMAKEGYGNLLKMFD